MSRSQNSKDSSAAFTTLSLDYCNALLHGLPNNLIHKIETVQNSATRVVKGLKIYEHIIQARKDLHSLPIEATCK